jgi:predicted transcriptional regulator
MPLNVPLRDAVRWLLESGNERERELLAYLRKGHHVAGELKTVLGVKHDPQVHRALEALDDLGLLERHYDTGKTKRGQVYSASPLGVRALELAERVDSFIEEHATRARA